MKTINTPSFTIKHFNDYHEIRSNTYKTIELGCFPVEEYGYCRYFGLFYKEAKPSLDRVMKRLQKKVSLGEFYHIRGGEDDIGITLNDLKLEVKRALKSSPDMPKSRY